jgi:hypothetical protein
MSTKDPAEPGSPRLAADDEAFYEQWSERVENDDDITTPSDVEVAIGPAATDAGRKLLEDLGITPPAAAPKKPGRPSLNGIASTGGRAKARQVRLPREVDAELDRRAATEKRTPSEIMREAITEYLRAS